MLTEPGLVTNQAPLLLDSLQFALMTAAPCLLRVSTETLWLWPETIEAQPEPSRLTDAKTTKLILFMLSLPLAPFKQGPGDSSRLMSCLVPTSTLPRLFRLHWRAAVL